MMLVSRRRETSGTRSSSELSTETVWQTKYSYIPRLNTQAIITCQTVRLFVRNNFLDSKQHLYTLDQFTSFLLFWKPMSQNRHPWLHYHDSVPKKAKLYSIRAVTEVVFHKLCRIARFSRVRKTESVRAVRCGRTHLSVPWIALGLVMLRLHISIFSI